MTQLDYIPDSPNSSPGSPETPLDCQFRATDSSQKAIDENKSTAPSSLTQENVAEPHSQTDLDKEDVTKDPTETNFTFEVAPSSQTGVHDTLGARSTEQNGFADPELRNASQPLLVNHLNKTDTTDDHSSNIVIFGETGVGKSSIINLIANTKRAQASNDALGCTFQYEKHIVKLDEIQCALWDTTGLDEGSRGAVPAEFAEVNLKDLIGKLIRSGGIHLVIYCIRATRLTTALKRNYDLFYGTVCRKKVPVALVVTGLEHQEGEMEMWWAQNEAFLKHCGMKFDAHACVTTVDIDDPVIQGRRSDSQKCLHDLVVQYASRRPWKIEESWSSAVFNSLPPGNFYLTSKKTVRRVVLYDRTLRPASNARGTCKLGLRQLEYKWVHINTPRLDTSTGPPGVLVFYACPLSSNDISLDDVAALMKFYNVTGGKTCPVIVVMRGCHDNEVVHKCWDAILSRHENILVHCIEDTHEKLEAMIEALCKEHEEVGWVSQLWKTLWDSVSVFI